MRGLCASRHRAYRPLVRQQRRLQPFIIPALAGRRAGVQLLHQDARVLIAGVDHGDHV
jgi:hypothetical protein